ncbi:hypothetical protein J2847_002445 [Azospirillum agricola]|nr:hypothetical protein [Azospirillum agricola]
MLRSNTSQKHMSERGTETERDYTRVGFPRGGKRLEVAPAAGRR